MRQPVRARRRRDRPEALLHRPLPGSGVAGGVRGAVRPAGRLWLRHVGVAVRADLATRRAAVRHPRLAHASTPRSARSTRPGWSTTSGRDVASGEVGELLLRNPTVTPGYWQMPRGDRGDGGRRLAAHRRPRHRGRGRHLHVRLAREGGAAAARPEPLADRGRGGDRGASRRARGGRRRGALGADRGRGQGVRRRGTRPQPRLRAAAGLDAPHGSPRSRSPGSGRPWTPSPARRPPGWPSTGSRWATRPTSTTRSPTFAHQEPRRATTPRTRGCLMDLGRRERRSVRAMARPRREGAAAPR